MSLRQQAKIDFFEEISKFRAARRLWAKIMKERFGATNPKAMMCRIHTQTAGSSLTAQQIDNNVVRTALEAMAAVLGGTQSLHTNARDEALALPTEASAELALRTQQIIAHETRVTDAVDPLGGSYYVEALTNQLEADAEALIRKIDERGGAAAAIEQNFIQDEISRSAYETQKRIDSGEQVVVGLNKFTGDEEQIPELQQIDLSGVEQQKTRLKAFKEKRNSTATQKTLLALKVATENGDNLLPPILDAVRSHATLGEISSVLREVYGEYKE